MTIRKTLLYAFLVVGLLPAILLAGMAFYKARQALEAEIERNIVVQTAGIAADIDKMMFERLQNAQTWSRLDIMQDLQVHDIDKRLARFLSDLHQGYRNVYVSLSCTDSSGNIISSSDPALIGHVSGIGQPWLATDLSGASISLAMPEEDGNATALMRVAIPSAFTKGSLGELQLRLDWGEIDRVLDQAASGGAMLAILDRSGRLIAASRNLRERGLLLGTALAGWRGITADGRTHTVPGGPVADASVIVGGATSRGYANFKGFGWTTLMIQPVDSALAPIHRMAVIFLVLLVLIILLTVVTANWVSTAIARPVVSLTQLTRDYLRSKILQAPSAAGTGEVAELSKAFVQMVRDIDQSQQNLIRASKLAVVGEMSSIIGHEVRTPLGILRSSAQMLAREAEISAEGKELVGFIESETERLNRLVSAMLDMARPRPPSYGDTDIHALIEHCIVMLVAQTAQKQIAVTTSLAATSPVIECDEEQITQVLLNLLMNGLQILAHGGRIEVATADEAEGLRIDIADDGPGINPAERARIFEAFFFRREGGVGLGLAIVQQIVLAHHGSIEAGESKLGGAQFTIKLPRRQAEER